ncbi:MAG: radical SAM protein [Methanosarcinales archaeon]|nr:radical SAM protein [Methanosarcinales archaeon]
MDSKDPIIWIHDQNRLLLDRLLLPLEKSHPQLYERFICPLKSLAGDAFCKGIASIYINNIISIHPFPLFSSIEIETINPCNNDCSFCPVSRGQDPRPYRLMDRKLFMSIIYQLKELEYSGAICLFSNNEPLLDRRMVEMNRIARNALPDAHLYLYTNGKLLTVDIFLRLMDHLNSIVIDNYSDDLTLNPPVQEIYSLVRDDRDFRGRVLIQVIRRRAIRSTRGGQAGNRGRVFLLRSSCLLPFTQLVVRPDGKVSLCCQDALGRFTLGDLMKQSILDVWNGNAYWGIRNKMLRGRHSLDFCRRCDHFHYPEVPYFLARLGKTAEGSEKVAGW